MVVVEQVFPTKGVDIGNWDSVENLGDTATGIATPCNLAEKKKKKK